MTDFREHFDGHLPLILAFASEPRFEWESMLASWGIAHVLFRDSTDQWYSSGIPGLGDVSYVVQYLRALDRQWPCIALGLSRGAYAAMKFAKLAEIERVIAVSPVTGCGEYIEPEFSPEWRHRVEHIRSFPIDDLKPLYVDGWSPHVQAFISDGDGAELDRQMCERIGLTDITFVPGYTHSDLARGMRDNGMMVKVVSDTAILIKFTEILRRVLKNESIVLTMETTRQDIPKWDSVAYLDFIMVIERELNLKFRLSDIESFRNVGEIIEVVSKK